MRIQIIYLDPADDHVSARDKLSMAQAPYLALVWPAEGQVLTRKLDLVLLQRYTRQHAARLGLVTSDRQVKLHAAALGIPVFASLEGLDRQSWIRRSGEPRLLIEPRGAAGRLERLGATRDRVQPAPPLSAGLRWTAFALGIAALLAMLIAVLPSATLTLLPPTITQTATLQLTLDPDLARPARDALPARWVRTRQLGEMTAPVSGEVLVPTVFASGDVLFSNLTSEPLLIPLGSGVRSVENPTIRFTTTHEAQLEGGGSALVHVRAAEPGSTANLAAGSLRSVDGLLGLSLAVTNPKPFTNGADLPQPGVSRADYQQLRTRLQQHLAQAASQQLSLAGDEALHPELLIVSNTFSQSYDAALGSVADTLSLTLDLEFSGLLYSQTDLESALRQGLDQALGDSRQGVPRSLKILDLEVFYNHASGEARLVVEASREVFQPLDPRSLAAAIRGAAPEAAVIRLVEQFPLLEARAELRPAWWPWLPWLSPRIAFNWEWDQR